MTWLATRILLLPKVRQEFILLGEILGLSLLADSIDHLKPAGSTKGTVLGLATRTRQSTSSAP
jgi:hypothetical protein